MLRLRDLGFDEEDDERCALRDTAATDAADAEADELRFPRVVIIRRFFLTGFLKKLKLSVGNFIFSQCQNTRKLLNAMESSTNAMTSPLYTISFQRIHRM